MKVVSVVITSLFLSSFFAQKSMRHNFWSRSELGLMGGGSYYVGDLNKDHFKNTNFGGQVYFRYNVHSRFAIKTNLSYGFVEAADKDASFDIYRNRNLSFQSKLWELASGPEFTYLPFEIGNKRYWGTGYLFAQLGLTKINPTTNVNGNEVELQAIGTEGQGSSLSDRGKYSKTQLVVPIGFGFRISLGANVGLNLEYGLRFIFTDYLDDVGSQSYLDPAQLLAANGSLAANLNNRSIDQDRFGMRGNSAGRDWYAWFGAGLSFRLGRKQGCPSAFN